MKNINAKRRFLFACMSAWGLFVSSTFGQGENGAFLQKLTQKLAEYQKASPAERVYVHCDKPFYKPGETIWFAAYLRNETDLKPSETSQIVRAEIYDAKGAKLRELALITQNGAACGDYTLAEQAPGGLYKIKAYTRAQKNDTSTYIFEKTIQIQEVSAPRLLMKLEFEREAYGPGATAVAKFSLRSLSNKPIAGKNIKYAISYDGENREELNAQTDGEGRARLTIALPADLKTKDVLLNVLVAHDGERESISRAVPVVLNKINLTIFPEGGDFIAGMKSKAAFIALNEYGKPADVSGYVTDETGARLATFSSYHDGMGAFAFTPKSDKKYKAVLESPTSATFDLPEALPRGYGLSVMRAGNRSLKVILHSTEKETLSVALQIRGVLYFTKAVPVSPGETILDVSTENFPAGTAQITLFDAKGIERAERLVFVNKDKQLKIELKTDKEKYQPREKVNLDVKITDERGIPVPGVVSLSVTDDKILSLADDKTGNILTQLLFEQDIKGKVEKAAFYFDPKEAKADSALDYLLLTRGWRRFTWKKVLDNSYPPQTERPEQTKIYGSIRYQDKNRPASGAKLRFLDPKNPRVYTANDSGYFEITDYPLYQQTNVEITSLEKGFEPRTVTFYTYGLQSAFPAGYHKYNTETIVIQEKLTRTQDIATSFQSFGGRDAVRKSKVPQATKKSTDKAKLNNVEDSGEREETREVLREGNEKIMLEVPSEPEPVPQEDSAQETTTDDDGDEDFSDNAERTAPTPEPEAQNADEDDAGEDLSGSAEPERDEFVSAQSGSASRGRKESYRPPADTILTATVTDKRLAPHVAPAQPTTTGYYRAREFFAPVYDGPAEVRTDFRSTIFWKGAITLDRTGKAKLSFYNSDEITAFRIIAEGAGEEGSIGRSECVYSTQLPFSMSVKVPTAVAMGDNVILPLVLKNNTDRPLDGRLTINAPEVFRARETQTPTIQIAPGAAQTVFLSYDVLARPGLDTFAVKFEAHRTKDAFTQIVRVEPRGFPARHTFSAAEKDKTFEVEIASPIEGTLEANLVVYPSPLAEALKGLEGLLREPYGCFEQTSSTVYPNIMIAQYFEETGYQNSALKAKTRNLLEKGYARLLTFETPEKQGFDWYGRSPATESLSAFALMEFKDMAKVNPDVDKELLSRLKTWLLSRKDGKGGFHNARVFGTLGGSVKMINAYILYALTEAGVTELTSEIDSAYRYADVSSDAYCMALTALALHNARDLRRAEVLLQKLAQKQDPDGSWGAGGQTVTYSGPYGQKLESTSLTVLAMLKNPGVYHKNIQSGIAFIRKSRTGNGAFGSTQSTVLALKALIAYSKYSKDLAQEGEIEFYANGKKVASRAFSAGAREAIEVKGLEKFLVKGKNDLRIKYAQGAENPLPFALNINYHSENPASDSRCAVKLETRLSTTQVKTSETARLTTKLTNVTAQAQPNPIALVGIPGGFSPQPWQLKELQEKNAFDYYEVVGSNVVFYFRQFAPNETREIALDLKAELPGGYESPASTAYLYYTPEYKCWNAPLKVQIK